MSSHQAMSPNQREVLSAVSTITSKQEYLTSTSGALNIAGSFSVTGGATSANQTNGQQLVQIVDAGGEAATVTGGKLDVNATASLAGSPIPISGASTAVGVAIVDGSGNQITSFGGGTQYTDGGVPPTHPIGNTIEWSDGSNWQTVSTAKPLPVTATFSPSGTQNVNLTQIGGASTAVGNGVAGTGVQRVTIASDNTAFSVNATLSAETTKVIGVVRNADGSGNLLTSTANALDINIKSGSIANTSFAATQATASSLNATVVGTGTFAVQATLAAETTKVIGTVNQGTSPWITSNATTSVVGNGAAATAQRVTIANDSTGVLATVGAVTAITNALPAGTNVIGHVITDTGSTTAVTGTVAISGTVTANAGTNLNTSLLALESGGNLASIKANTDNLNLAIGSTTSGQKGNLVLTATTTATPTYTTAQSNPLSTTTTGLLRVDGSGVTQPVSLTSTTITGTVAVTQSGTWTNTVTQATASSLNATVVQGTAAALSAGWPTLNGEAADTTGTFTNATQTTSVTASSLDGYANVLVSINGTYGTATAVFEGSDDSGTTWYGISEADRTDSNVIESGYTSLTNTSRAWQISNPGWDSIRVRSTAVASGTVNVRISPSSAPTSAGASVSVGTALPTGTNTIGAVNIAASQTIAVTNTGTFATQPTIQTGTNSIGKISDITTSVVPGTAATNLGKAEDAGHTTGDTGVMSLGVRNDTLAATTNTTADYTQLSTDQAGIVMTAGAPRALKGRQVTTLTSSTAETTIITSVASTFLDLYGLILANTSATATKVSIRDATAGGTISVFYVPAGDTRGFMLPLDSAIPQAAVTNNWTAQCGTSVASLEVTALFVKRV